MRLAYGAMGHGRGHAMRSSAMIDRLGSKHTVPVYAGPDACRVMKGRYDCELIPSIHYHDGASGSIDAAMTIKRNLRPGLDLLFAGPHARRLSASWDRFEPELVISDSETWSPQLARALGIPRISLDHGGIMAYCRPRFPGTDQLLAQRDRFADLSMMGCPKQSMVSSCHPAEPWHRDVCVFGPILRPMAYGARPQRGEHLLAYFNKGAHQHHDSVAKALRACGRAVIIHGSGREGRVGNLLFRAPSQPGFVDDLAGVTAVIATTGHQLAADALWLGKPMLLLPEAAVEQRLNASMADRLGTGAHADLSGCDIQRFPLRLDDYRAAMGANRRAGLDEARQALCEAMDWINPRKAPA